ncbi:hypothetical protein J4G37_26940 [Microvirga sp. 3-52]|nr:hypothetical protein [Microvirga sp. 3-52]
MRAACLTAWIAGACTGTAATFSAVITGLVPVIPILWSAALVRWDGRVRPGRRGDARSP